MIGADLCTLCVVRHISPIVCGKCAHRPAYVMSNLMGIGRVTTVAASLIRCCHCCGLLCCYSKEVLVTTKASATIEETEFCGQFPRPLFVRKLWYARISRKYPTICVRSKLWDTSEDHALHTLFFTLVNFRCFVVNSGEIYSMYTSSEKCPFSCLSTFLQVLFQYYSDDQFFEVHISETTTAVKH